MSTFEVETFYDGFENPNPPIMKLFSIEINSIFVSLILPLDLSAALKTGGLA